MGIKVHFHKLMYCLVLLYCSDRRILDGIFLMILFFIYLVIHQYEHENKQKSNSNVKETQLGMNINE